MGQRVVGGQEHAARAPRSRIASSASSSAPTRARRRERLEHAQHLEVERELLVRGREPALEPAGRVQDEVAPARACVAHSDMRLGRGLGVERVRRAQPAAAAERQPVAAGELAAGERAEHRLGHAERRAAAAHVDGREERAEEAGAPGRIACAIATPVSASATCSARPPATLTGAVAPASRNGVTITGWFASAHSVRASTIRKSQTSGLFGLTTPMIAGLALDPLAAAAGDRRQLDRVTRPRAGGAVADVGLVRPAEIE